MLATVPNAGAGTAEQAERPAVVEAAGLKLAFFSYSDHPEAWAVGQQVEQSQCPACFTRLLRLRSHWASRCARTCMRQRRTLLATASHATCTERCELAQYCTHLAPAAPLAVHLPTSLHRPVGHRCPRL